MIDPTNCIATSYQERLRDWPYDARQPISSCEEEHTVLIPAEIHSER